MLLATVSTLPGADYVAVGILHARANGVGTQEPIEGALQQLEQAAIKMGADAVIGIQVSATVYRTFNFDVKSVVLLGTAIKFTRASS